MAEVDRSGAEMVVRHSIRCFEPSPLVIAVATALLFGRNREAALYSSERQDRSGYCPAVVDQHMLGFFRIHMYMYLILPASVCLYVH